MVVGEESFWVGVGYFEGGGGVVELGATLFWVKSKVEMYFELVLVGGALWGIILIGGGEWRCVVNGEAFFWFGWGGRESLMGEWGWVEVVEGRWVWVAVGVLFDNAHNQ